jgi:peroxiredoxin
LRKQQRFNFLSVVLQGILKTAHNVGRFRWCATVVWQSVNLWQFPSPKFFKNQEYMMIKVGDTLPAATLMEFSEVEGNGCSIGPNPIDVTKATAGKTIALFALPGAFTPTCSAKHVPGYVESYTELKAAGVDEIWCVSVNDAFVMGAWARDQKSDGKVRMLADGSAAFTQATGLTLDLTSKGMGLRSNRYSMLVKDGKVSALNIEGPGKFEVSDAATLLAQAKA